MDMGPTQLNSTNLTAVLSAFFTSMVMWLIYFNLGQEAAHHCISSAADKGQTVRVAYTYIPIVLVSGVIAEAVSDELTLALQVAHA